MEALRRASRALFVATRRLLKSRVELNFTKIKRPILAPFRDRGAGRLSSRAPRISRGPGGRRTAPRFFRGRGAFAGIHRILTRSPCSWC
jgi:hypothetical protein